ncbi:uncharacterized protein LOC130941531 isoform X2 [Arachis stenosperma]|uniref:uncharacterized protein LOC130941531 isoform X2 n=1 Tax=Arachis stenosperma TaxID=217475 RepID=UPI0025AC4644|nr:uncharacterized protein LOC130941531 isoform X2 [Arachis stenosperma]
MALPRNLLSRCHIKTPPFPHSHRLVTTTNHHHNNNNNNKKQPLHALFMEAVGLKHHHHPQQEQESESESNFELKRNLTQLQQQLRTFNKHVPVINTKRRSLFSVFTNQPPEHDTQIVNNKKREPMILKELSPEMEGFLELLFQMGYFNHANFAKGKDMFDLSWFDTEFGRGYIKFAAQRFGREKQELAKWLSGSALKEVAMFGCPSVDKVCSKCALRESCKFENQSVWKGDTKILNLVVVMKVLTSYDLEMVHPKLVVPDTVKNSVRKLLKEATKLSQTISD